MDGLQGASSPLAAAGRMAQASGFPSAGKCRANCLSLLNWPLLILSELIGYICALIGVFMMMVTPLPVERAIQKLGDDMSRARRRRHMSQASLAERMGASLSTVRRMEKGDGRVPVHFFARALHVFGEVEALAQLLDTPNDTIGLTLMDEQLPKRVRSKQQGPSGAL